MPIETFPGLPEGYQVWSKFLGRYVLAEAKDKPLIIISFPYRPTLKRCLKEIQKWETLRANVRACGPVGG